MDYQVLIPPRNMMICFCCQKLTMVTSGFSSCFAQSWGNHAIWGISIFFHFCFRSKEMTKVAVPLTKTPSPGGQTQCKVMCPLILSRFANWKSQFLKDTSDTWYSEIVRFPLQTVDLSKSKFWDSQLLGGLMSCQKRCQKLSQPIRPSSILSAFKQIIWVKQCHKPATTGHGNHTTYFFYDWGMVSWLIESPLWKIRLRQLGWWFPIQGQKHVPNHHADM